MNHWVNPAIIGNRLYVTSFQGRTFCLSIANEGGYIPGQIIWTWNDPLKPIGSTCMYAGAGARQSGGVTRLYVASSGTGTNVYCLEDQGASPSLIWRSSQTGSFEGAAIWANAPGYPQGVVYCPAYDGNLYAFDASNGNLVWTFPAGGTTKCGVSIVNDLLVLCSNSDVRMLKAP
jgi:outer membrane protein assembly factor BamB